MTDPKRWIDDGAPDRIRTLIIAASAEQPREASAERALVALGVAGAFSAGVPSAAASLATGGAPAAAKGATAGSVALALKWGFVGMATAVVTIGLASVVLKPAAPTSLAVSSRVPPPGRSTTWVGRTPRRAAADPGSPAAGVASPEVPSGPSAPALAARLAPPVTSALLPSSNPRARPLVEEGARTPGAAAEKTATESRATAARQGGTSIMEEEVSVIDQARTSLARGDAPATIALLDGYASQFAVRRFEPEALYLRMEALGRLGDVGAERAVAERLVRTFPSAPQSARARAVLR